MKKLKIVSSEVFSKVSRPDVGKHMSSHTQLQALTGMGFRTMPIQGRVWLVVREGLERGR